MNTMLLQMPPVMDNSTYDSYAFITVTALHPSYLRQLCHVWYFNLYFPYGIYDSYIMYVISGIYGSYGFVVMMFMTVMT